MGVAATVTGWGGGGGIVEAAAAAAVRLRSIEVTLLATVGLPGRAGNPGMSSAQRAHSGRSYNTHKRVG